MTTPEDLEATIRKVGGGIIALDACRLLTQWAADRTDLPDGLDVIVRAAWDAVLAGGPRCYRPSHPNATTIKEPEP